jgi:hypothetical protein
VLGLGITVCGASRQCVPEMTLRPRASKEPQGFRQDPRSPATVYLSGPENRKFRSSRGVRPCVLQPLQQFLALENQRGRADQAGCAGGKSPPGRQKSRRSGFFAITRCGGAFPNRGEKSKSSSSFRRSRLHPRLLRRMRSAAPANCVCQEKTTRCRVFREISPPASAGVARPGASLGGGASAVMVGRARGMHTVSPGFRRGLLWDSESSVRGCPWTVYTRNMASYHFRLADLRRLVLTRASGPGSNRYDVSVRGCPCPESRRWRQAQAGCRSAAAIE